MSAERARSVIERLRQAGVEGRLLQADSRRLLPGEIFAAWPGAGGDGRRHIADAVACGAGAVLWDSADGFDPGPLSVPAFGVEGLRALSGHIAHVLCGRPSAALWVAGVTGTNGKTTVSQWIAQALAALGLRCGVIGTLGQGYPGALEPLLNTTPDAVSLHRMLADLRDDGARAVAMEVSSIGLDQGRVNGVEFDVAVFTNLTRDHLEYHGTMEAYAQAKALLFELPGLAQVVLNLDDPFGRQQAALAVVRGQEVIGYTREGAAAIDGVRQLSAEAVAATPAGLRFTARWHDQHADIALNMVGEFNVSNALAVIGSLLMRGIAFDEAARAVAALVPPPGRMQLFGGVGEPLVVVDYAHTPDALAKVLESVRDTARRRGGRVACVFGCGGERDPGKRVLMGEVASRLADRVLVTSDNPRGEAPRAIADAVLAGAGPRAQCELDRAAAIRRAVSEAAIDDVVVIAGKGHEPYQEVCGVRHPFSDAEQTAAALRARGAGPGVAA